MDAVIVGFGFLGRGLVEALASKWGLVASLDPDFRLVGVSNSKGYIWAKEGISPNELVGAKSLTQHPLFVEGGQSTELLERAAPQMVVELTPTNIVDGEPGLTHIRSSLRMGAHVVTANKGALAHAYWELVAEAEKQGRLLLYEATVAGAVPVFSLVRECLRGDSVTRILGILNGTANYILSRMHFEEVSFEAALKEAKERGLTERDPTIDIEGYDAALKAVILANAIMGKRVKLGDVKRRGIAQISLEALRLAKRSNQTVKLVATIEQDGLEVAPRLVPLNHPLCVHGTLNSVHFETDLAGQLTLVGHGAGRQTVSAIFNDMLTVLRAARDHVGH